MRIAVKHLVIIPLSLPLSQHWATRSGMPKRHGRNEKRRSQPTMTLQFVKRNVGRFAVEPTTTNSEHAKHHNNPPPKKNSTVLGSNTSTVLGSVMFLWLQTTNMSHQPSDSPHLIHSSPLPSLASPTPSRRNGGKAAAQSPWDLGADGLRTCGFSCRNS